MLDEQQNLIDRMKLGQAIPLTPPITRIKIDKQLLYLGSENESLKSEDYLNWEKAAHFQQQTSTPSATLPHDLKSWINTQNLPSSLSWERVLLDLHSGRIMGQLGPWIMELSAWGLILLVITGLWLQAQRTRLKYQRKNLS